MRSAYYKNVMLKAQDKLQKKMKEKIYSVEILRTLEHTKKYG